MANKRGVYAPAPVPVPAAATLSDNKIGTSKSWIENPHT